MRGLALPLIILATTVFPVTAYPGSDIDNTVKQVHQALIAAGKTAKQYSANGEEAKALKTMERAYEAARKAELAAIGQLEPGAKAPSDDYHFAESMFGIADSARNQLANLYRERNCRKKTVALRQESVAAAERLAIREKGIAKRLMRLYQRLPNETGDEKLKLGRRLIAFYSEKPHRHQRSVNSVLGGQARVFLAMGDKESAQRYYQKYISENDKTKYVESPELNPTPDQQLRMFFGDLALKREFAERTLSHRENKKVKVGNHNISLSFAYIRRGLIAGEQGEFERELEDYRTALELFGNSQSQYFTAAYPATVLARALMRQNNELEAGKLAARNGICLE